MNLSALTDRDAVLDAIAEFRRLGRQAFLEKYGFKPARRYFVVHDGERFDSKALAAAAIGYQYPDHGALKAANFSGGEATVKRRLEMLEFKFDASWAAIPRSDDMWLVAYALSRCSAADGSPPVWLGVSNWNEAYSQFFEALSDSRSPETFANSLKNARDTFDAFVERSARIGWRRPDHSVPELRGGALRVLAVWQDRSEAAVREAVLAIRDSAPRQAARSGGGQIRLLTNGDVLGQAWRRWFQAITTDAEKVGPGRWWNSGVRLHVRAEGTAGAPGRVALSLEESPQRWTVELNPLDRPGDGNLLTGIGQDDAGALWLLRQGWLHPHAASAPHIKGGDFRAATGLSPVAVQVASGPIDREWFNVCQLNGSDAAMLAATTLFVARCDLARRQHDPEPPSQEELTRIQDLLASDETMGFLLRRAKPAEEERRIWKKHAEVWSALNAELGRVDLQLLKVRPVPGYEVDGVIALPEPLLVEIKTSASAADIYTAVGQLTLYRRMMCPNDSHHLIMVLPKAPPSSLLRVLRELAFHVCVYTRDGGGTGKASQIRFDETLSRLWQA